MRTKILSAVYFLSAILFIFPQLRPPFLTDVLSKGLIILVLIVLFLASSGNVNTWSQRMIFIGLFFSWIGDIVLEIEKNGEMMFMIGLTFFLRERFSYLIAFIMPPGNGGRGKKLIMMILPVVIYGMFLLAFIFRDLGEMRLPVVIYALVILAMLAAAITRGGKTGIASFWLVLAGATLFVLSDSLLAVNKFSYAIPAAPVLIMSTYVLGQFLIVIGFLRQTGNR